MKKEEMFIIVTQRVDWEIAEYQVRKASRESLIQALNFCRDRLPEIWTSLQGLDYSDWNIQELAKLYYPKSTIISIKKIDDIVVIA